ncbi:YqkE family protein [Paenibacillus mendelii]|uniref:YqkE family protein n=1 Tax=Paenibacillus mendelii TaxID=206163 RepID=A0ABV6J9K8_9BACL|nr:YqkE family protein [Paenibacillus mendelii]MCQ6561157.1 YqkE family protein [Paenibacillus mendelii]
MAKAKKRGPAASRNERANSAERSEDKPATLKDLLRPELVEKLKAASDELKSAEETRKEAERKRAEDARLAEQKRLENDFGHLLENSKLDWRKHK